MTIFFLKPLKEINIGHPKMYIFSIFPDVCCKPRNSCEKFSFCAKKFASIYISKHWMQVEASVSDTLSEESPDSGRRV
jgi:hypothetical protein